MSDFLNIKITGVSENVVKLSKFIGRLDQMNRAFLEKLSDIGFDVANTRFSQAQYDGYNDVNMENTQWVDDNTIRIRASGTTVLFIEFGTGVHYTEHHPLESLYGYARGGYGLHRGLRDTWTYYGQPGTDGVVYRNGKVSTHGNPPARAMYDAGKEMRQRILEVAREVYV